MPQPEDQNAVYMPVFSAFWAIADGEHDDIRYFNTNTLSWSVTRLFGYYERVLSVLDLPRAQRRFVDADLESFIVRFRIVLNDLAYAVRLLLPEQVRGLGPPTGGTHPKNREMSVFTLTKFFATASGSSAYPELASVFASATPWMSRLKEDRDNVVHYKAMVEVYEGSPLTFAISNPAGTERREPREGGGTKLLLTPVGQFLDEQMVALYSFMNESLFRAMEAHAVRTCMKLGNGRGGFRIAGPGIERFRRRNGRA